MTRCCVSWLAERRTTLCMSVWPVCMHWSVYSALCVYVCLSGLCACIHTQCTVCVCLPVWPVCMHWSVYSALCVSVWPVYVCMYTVCMHWSAMSVCIGLCVCIGLYTVHCVCLSVWPVYLQ